MLRACHVHCCPQTVSLVAQNILLFDNKFWLRLATRCDTAANAEEKEAVQALADTLMKIVNKAKEQTENQLASSKTVRTASLLAQ